MRKNYIKLAKDDRVEVEISPYDISKCRITYRYRPGQQIFNSEVQTTDES